MLSHFIMSKFVCEAERKSQEYLYANMTQHQKREADKVRLFHARELTKAMTDIMMGNAIQYVGETKTQKKTAKTAKKAKTNDAKAYKQKAIKKKEDMRKEIMKLQSEMSMMCQNTTPVVNIPALNASMDKWNKSLSKTRRQHRVVTFVHELAPKIGKRTGRNPEYDIGQLERIIQNGGKYNLKDWEAYLKKDLPTRQNVPLVPNILELRQEYE